jgi:hypothetical protein
MQAENSWDPRVHDADAEAGFGKRLQLLFWRLLPMTPVL